MNTTSSARLVFLLLFGVGMSSWAQGQYVWIPQVAWPANHYAQIYEADTLWQLVSFDTRGQIAFRKSGGKYGVLSAYLRDEEGRLLMSIYGGYRNGSTEDPTLLNIKLFSQVEDTATVRLSFECGITEAEHRRLQQRQRLEDVLRDSAICACGPKYLADIQVEKLVLDSLQRRLAYYKMDADDTLKRAHYHYDTTGGYRLVTYKASDWECPYYTHASETVAYYDKEDQLQYDRKICYNEGGDTSAIQAQKLTYKEGKIQRVQRTSGATTEWTEYIYQGAQLVQWSYTDYSAGQLEAKRTYRITYKEEKVKAIEYEDQRPHKTTQRRFIFQWTPSTTTSIPLPKCFE